MNQNKGVVCPGCKRGCSMENVRCKFGRVYFAGNDPGESKKKKKWERMVASDGLAWRFLTLSKAMKKGLCKKELQEEQMFAALTPEERAVLLDMLGKVEESCFKKHGERVYMNQSMPKGGYHHVGQKGC